MLLRVAVTALICGAFLSVVKNSLTKFFFSLICVMEHGSCANKSPSERGTGLC